VPGDARPAVSVGTTVEGIDEPGPATTRPARKAPRPEPDETRVAAGTLIDHFRVIRPIGRGGMGEVFLARDVRLGRKVALKMVHSRRIGSEQAIQRFLFEARTTARFSHPHIVTIHAVGEHGGHPYVALEYLEGQNLRERLAREVPSAREVARMGLAVAEALAEAHDHGVLHRDLKPENVLIPRDGRIRVVDFGLAKVLAAPAEEFADTERDTSDGDEDLDSVDSFRTEGHKLCGTPVYMAPEQWEDADITGATDIWALGVMLYEAIAGQRPYVNSEAETGSLAVRVCGPEPVPGAPPLLEIPGDLSDLIYRCLEKEPDLRPTAAEVVEILQAFLVPGRERLIEEEGPFRGLQAFTERHAGYFFGRDAEIAGFLERLRTEPILPVVGPSGAGKSSFVQAGVIPRLREQGAWTVLNLRPGADPFGTLATRLLAGESTQRALSSRRSAPVRTRGTDTAQLSRLETATYLGAGMGTRDPDQAAVPTPGDDDPEELAGILRRTPRRLNLALQQIADAEGGRVLLLIDQLEEIYSLVEDEDERGAFMQAICTAADDPESPVRVVFTLRDDFLGRLAIGQEAREALSRVTVLRSPAQAALEEILTRPVEAAGYRYDDPELVGEMLAEVRGEPACLPLLQFTARVVWDRRDRERRLLRASAYRAIGGVAGALADHAQSVLAGLSPDQARAARDLLLRLVTPDGTRRRLARSSALDGLAPEAGGVLDRLIQSRLLAVHKGSSDADAEVELVHESLIRNWRQLRQWIEEGREELAFMAEVGQAAELWDRRGRHREEVWGGDALAEALRTLERLPGQAPAAILEFLDASRHEEQRHLRRRRIAAGIGVAALALVAVGALVAALALADKEREAQQQRRAAELGQAEARLGGARAALERGDRLEARAQLRGALETELSPLGRALWGQLTIDPLVWAHELGAAVNDVTFTPDGASLVVACGDRSIYIFDTVTREVRVLRGHADQVYTAVVSPDGRWVASGSWSGELRLWDLQTGETRQLAGHTAGINFLVFNHDGTQLASGSDDRTVRLWDLASGEEPRVLEEQPHRVYGVAFSPDGTQLASACRDHVVRLWDVASGELVDQLPPRPTSLTNLTYSPDGGLLALAGPAVNVSIWDLQTREERQLLGHSGKVWDVAFTPDGTRLVSASRDGSARIWDVVSGRELAVVEGPGNGLYCVGVSHDGRRFAVGGADKTVQLWELTEEVGGDPMRGHTRAASSVAFSPDGRTVASGGADGTVRTWDVATGAQLTVVETESKDLPALAYAPDGARLWAGGNDGKIRLWLTDAPGRRRTIEGNRGGVADMVFSRDGTFAVTAGGSAQPYRWDPRTRANRQPYAGHSDIATTAAIAPDGRSVATAGYANTIHLWDPTDGTRIRILEGHTGTVRDLDFDPRGGRLASVSDDGTIRLWRTDDGTFRSYGPFDARLYGVAFHPSGETLAVAQSDGTARVVDLNSGARTALVGHRAEVNAVAYSPDGTRIATASDDGTVRLWDPETGLPAWRSSLLLGPPVRVATHRGWTGPGVAEAAPEPRAWHEAALQRGLAGALSPGGNTLCLRTGDGLEAWDVTRDERLFSETDGGVQGVLARDDGCVAVVRGGEDGTTGTGDLRFYARAGDRLELAGDVVAAFPDGDELLVAGPSSVRVLDAGGETTREVATGAGVTAALRSGEQLVVGFSDGSLELFPLVAGRDKPTYPFEEVPSSPVVNLQEGPKDTLIAGFANGQVGIWYRDNGQRLRRAQVHGPVSRVLLDGTTLHVASELGDHAALDLSAYFLDECALLRSVWDRVPVVWESGLPVRRDAPRGHRCASP